jgi:hypothetical protein
MTLRRKLSKQDQAQAEKQEALEQTAYQLRAKAERFTTDFALSGLSSKLPLPFPSRRKESLVFRARSWYTYPGWDALADAVELEHLTAFYVAILLIDFSPLRAELVELSKIHLNAPGQTPFDPVSLFLCCLLRWEKGLGWQSLADLLAGPEGVCWRELFGFQKGQTPAASTMRGFYKALEETFKLDLCPRFIELLCDVNLLPGQADASASSSRPGLAIAGDGMLHEAHSTMRCGQVTDTCYERLSSPHSRPCPAQDKGFDGCTCSEEKCLERCYLTTPRDPLARLIHYTGSNQEGEEVPGRARNVYGYRSYPQVACDDELHTYWVAYTSLHSAIGDERNIMPEDFVYLCNRLPNLLISEFITDAAAGFADCLNAVYDRQVIPVIAIRHAQGDKDPDCCKIRGYDAKGYPLCAHGYRMSFNGIDYKRLRACWVCRQVCAQHPHPNPHDADCPYRDPDRPLGMTRHIRRAFEHPDGSHHERLARLFPYDSPLWKEHYGPRKNAVEGRNSQIARLGLKRMWSYGLEGAIADITFADLLINLRTLGRLVKQATLLAG